MKTLIFLLSSCAMIHVWGLEIDPLPIDAQVTGNILTGPSVLNDPDRFVWGGSVIKGDDGRYHMLYSTWESGSENLVFTYSWAMSSKIGDVVDMDRLERPQLLIDEHGNPQVLYAAGALVNVNPRNDGSSFNVHIPLKIKR